MSAAADTLKITIALAKVEGGDFPHLALADAGTVRQGRASLPSAIRVTRCCFSVTKGIVSAVGQLEHAGRGTWIQTDAPINSGNSGGRFLMRVAK